MAFQYLMLCLVVGIIFSSHLQAVASDKATDEDMDILRMGYGEALELFVSLIKKEPDQHPDLIQWKTHYQEMMRDIEIGIREGVLTRKNFAEVSNFAVLKKHIEAGVKVKSMNDTNAGVLVNNFMQTANHLWHIVSVLKHEEL